MMKIVWGAFILLFSGDDTVYTIMSREYEALC